MPTALITGANRGIGLHLAKTFKANGWTVLATARNADTANELKNYADQVFPLDVSSEKSIASLASSLGSTKIDLLFNNAGIYNRADFRDNSTSMQPLVDEFMTNSLGALFLSRALISNLEQSSSPRIVNMTSRMGSIADNTSGGSYGYRASKAALNALTKSFSIDYPSITTILIHPGFIQTDMTSGRGDMGPEECAQKIYERVMEMGTKWKSGDFVHRDGEILPW